MSEAFLRLIKNHQKDPYFNLVDVVDGAVSEAERINSCDVSVLKHETFSRQSDFDLPSSVCKQELRVGKFSGCMLIRNYGGSDFEKAFATYKAMMEKGTASPQMASFLIQNIPPRLSFHTFLEGISYDVLQAGTASECRQSLEQWCQDSESPNLMCRFPKRPSNWLKDINHDYFSNGLKLYCQDMMRDSDFAALQYEIDFWQNALRGILLKPKNKQASRAFKFPSFHSESGVFKRIYNYRHSYVLFVPLELSQNLEANGLEEGKEFVTYKTGTDLHSYFERHGSSKDPKVLVWDASLGPVPERPLNVPLVLIGKEVPLKTWNEWRDFIAENGIASFSKDTFPRMAVIKRDAWRPYCFATPKEALNRILQAMLATHKVLAILDEGDLKTRLQEKVFHALAGVWSAHALYLGHDKQFLPEIM